MFRKLAKTYVIQANEKTSLQLILAFSSFLPELKYFDKNVLYIIFLRLNKILYMANVIVLFFILFYVVKLKTYRRIFVGVFSYWFIG